MRDAWVDLSDVVDGCVSGLMMSLFSPVYKFLVVLSFTQNCMVSFYILVNLGCWFFNASVHASASWTPHAFSFYASKNDQSEALSYTKRQGWSLSQFPLPVVFSLWKITLWDFYWRNIFETKCSQYNQFTLSYKLPSSGSLTIGPLTWSILENSS